MVLPDIYFFARGSNDLSYIDKTDEEVLDDFARFLGGPKELLVPAWDCMQRNLETLPTDLPQRLRNIKLTGNAAKNIPGGPQGYLEILAQQTESRIRLLQVTSKPAHSDHEAAEKTAEGISALVSWWNAHHYVVAGNAGDPFSWKFVHSSQVATLRKWVMENVRNRTVVSKEVAAILSNHNVLPETLALKRVEELLSH